MIVKTDSYLALFKIWVQKKGPKTSKNDVFGGDGYRFMLNLFIAHAMSNRRSAAVAPVVTFP